MIQPTQHPRQPSPGGSGRYSPSGTSQAGGGPGKGSIIGGPATRVKIGDYVACQEWRRTTRIDAKGDSFPFDEPIAFIVIGMSGTTIYGAPQSLAHTIEPGEGMLAAAWKPFRMVVGPPAESVTLYLPKRKLDALGVEITQTLTPLASTGEAMRSLRDLLTEVTRSTGQLSPDHQIRFAAALDSIVASICAENSLAGSETDGHYSTRRREIALFVSTKFQDHTLSCLSVARHFKTTTRSINRSFAGTGTSLANEIMQTRVQYALALMADQRLRSVKLSEIQRRSGFSTTSQFRRSIVVVTGATPSQYRARQATQRDTQQRDNRQRDNRQRETRHVEVDRVEAAADAPGVGRAEQGD